MLEVRSEKIDCPYCGENFEIVIDCSETQQSYIEDCWVCCRPINLHVTIESNGDIAIHARHENDC